MNTSGLKEEKNSLEILIYSSNKLADIPFLLKNY